MRGKPGFVCLSILFFLLFLSPVFADMGMVVWPPEVSLEESGQNAIVAWNKNEEVLILSTDVEALASSLTLRILPLPSNPSEVKEGSFDSFTKITEIINRKNREKYQAMGGSTETPGVEITFQKNIGAHDLTVVSVDDLSYFMGWIDDFILTKGLEQKEISSEFRNTVSNYLNRDIKFFAFDVIDTNETKQSVKPLIYRFGTDFLYYPLEITATSDVGWTYSIVNIFLITKGEVNETVVRNVKLYPMAGFEYDIELGMEDLEEISQDVAELFSSDPLVVNAYYYGSLDKLDKDLIVYGEEVYEEEIHVLFPRVLPILIGLAVGILLIVLSFFINKSLRQ